ncbi:MAG: hypothetical protein B6D73_14270 [gamma proteobacterium symbiont of Stewartia floridana]|nr:MAG: hypothetical protein B6D73_14270 [gamma proteobacterium symbiont of Stewartia floridana]
MEDYLAKILVKLQIHISRLRGFVRDFNDQSHIGMYKPIIVSYLYGLGELYALVAKLFPFARNEENMDYTPLDWDDFHNAYENLKIWTDLHHVEGLDLEGLTKRAIERNDSID